MVRETLIATIPSPTLLALHARAADLLSADPEAVAWHAEAIGDRQRAARGWLQAAERALARFAASDAVSLAGRAAAIAGELDDDELLGRALVVRGRAHEAEARYGMALEDHTAAERAARRAGDRRLQMVVLRELAGDVPVALGHPPADGEPLLRRCLQLAESLGDRGIEADVLGRLTVLRSSSLDFAEARRWRAARSLGARRPTTPRAHAHGLDAVKTAAAYLGLAPSWRRSCEELEPLLRRLGDLWMLQWAVFESCVVPLAAGDDGAALDRIEAALRDLPAQRLHPLRAVLRRPPGLGAPAGRADGRRPAGGSPRRGPGRGAPAHLVVDDRGRAVRAARCSRSANGRTGRRPNWPGRGRRGRAGRRDVPAPLPRSAGRGTGDPAVLARADALLRGIRVPEGCAWLLGADAYLGVARAWRRARRSAAGRRRS